MSSTDDPSGEREFLHNLSNIVAVAQGNLHLALLKAKKSPDQMKKEDLMAKMEVSLNAMNKMIDALTARRDIVRSRIETS